MMCVGKVLMKLPIGLKKIFNMNRIKLIHFFLFALGLSGQVLATVLGITQGITSSFFWIALAIANGACFALMRTDLWIGKIR